MAKYKNCNDSGWQDSLSARLLLNQSLSLKNYFTVRNLCKKFCCFTDFLKNENLQNIKKFCESQIFFAKYAVLHRKLQYLKEKWCSSPKIILQNVSSQTWLQPSCDKKITLALRNKHFLAWQKLWDGIIQASKIIFCESYCWASYKTIFRQELLTSPMFLHFLRDLYMVWKNQEGWEFWLIH